MSCRYEVLTFTDTMVAGIMYLQVAEWDPDILL